MFAIEVEYLLGRSFAGSFRDQSQPEWPPHPGRLFSALAAAYFETGGSEREKRALEWLEQQPPPAIRAGEPGEGTAPQAFVPTNYVGDGPPALRGKQPRFFPSQGPSDAMVYFIWAGSPADAETAEAIDRLANRVGYLGKACSVIRMRVCERAPAPNFAPNPRGGLVLRVPNRGRLLELASLFQANRRPSAGAQERYGPAGAEEDRAQAAGTEFGQMAVFRRASGPGLPIEATLTLTDAVRQALMSLAGERGDVPRLLHGHHHDTHCAIVALPFAGREHADGRLMGFGMVFPKGSDPEERRRVLGACFELEARGLHIPGCGDWTVEGADAASPVQALRPATWTRPARRWHTVTPILLDRFPKKNGASVEEIVAAACERIGLPRPARVEHGAYSPLRGVPPVASFRLLRGADDRPRWGVHATLAFDADVRGPVLLGAGRYFGLGLMRPDPEGRNRL